MRGAFVQPYALDPIVDLPKRNGKRWCTRKWCSGASMEEVWQLVLDSSHLCGRSTCDTQLDGSKPFCRDHGTYHCATTHGVEHVGAQVVNAYAGMRKSVAVRLILYLYKATSPSPRVDRRALASTSIKGGAETSRRHLQASGHCRWSSPSSLPVGNPFSRSNSFICEGKLSSP
jgi:hypothetical protein